MPNVSNRRASPALRGQAVTVTLDSNQALTVLPALSVGDECECESSEAIGYIHSIDAEGNTFKIMPENPAASFNSEGKAVLSVDELITIT